MKRIFTAAIAVAAAALAGAIPARAITFPALTQIYVASGVTDNSPNPNQWLATVVHCSNMSGQTASVRYQFRRLDGTIAAGGTLLLANLAAQTVGTQGDIDYTAETSLPTGNMFGGTLQILSTQSAIFCSAMVIHAGGAATGPAGVPLHMVRFNPHPGTVE